MTLDTLKDASNSDLDALVRDDKQWFQVVGGVSNSIF